MVLQLHPVHRSRTRQLHLQGDVQRFGWRKQRLDGDHHRCGEQSSRGHQSHHPGNRSFRQQYVLRLCERDRCGGHGIETYPYAGVEGRGWRCSLVLGLCCFRGIRRGYVGLHDPPSRGCRHRGFFLQALFHRQGRGCVALPHRNGFAPCHQQCPHRPQHGNPADRGKDR